MANTYVIKFYFFNNNIFSVKLAILPKVLFNMVKKLKELYNSDYVITLDEIDITIHKKYK